MPSCVLYAMYRQTGGWPKEVLGRGVRSCACVCSTCIVWSREPPSSLSMGPRLGLGLGLGFGCAEERRPVARPWDSFLSLHFLPSSKLPTPSSTAASFTAAMSDCVVVVVSIVSIFHRHPCQHRLAFCSHPDSNLDSDRLCPALPPALYCLPVYAVYAVS